MREVLRIWAAFFALASLPAAAALPSTFQPVVGGGVLCHDHTEHKYFNDYLTQVFKPSYKTEGGAYWFKPENKQRLFGLELTDIFISVDSVRYAFIGVVFKEKLEVVEKKLREERGIRFEPYAPPDEKASPDVLRSPAGAFLIRYNATQSKLYCPRHRIDPWRGEKKPPATRQEKLKLSPPLR